MKRLFLRYRVLVGFIFTASALLFPLHLAQATTMSPTRLELDGDPGKTAQTTITVYNDEKVTRTFYISAVRFETKNETGEPDFVLDDKTGLVSWMHLPNTIQVAPLTYYDINIPIEVPKDAAPGGYFAAVFASILPPGAQGNTPVSLKTDVGTLVLFRVNGDFAKEDSLLEFDTLNHKYWYANLPVEFYFRFQNSGADRAQPLGDITIHNLLGGIAKIITANKGAGNVLPQSIRRFESAWVSSGGDRVEQHVGKVEYPQFNGYWSHVKYEWQNFAFGRYRADLRVTINNDSSRTHAKSIVFWVVPWHLLLLILGGLAVLFVAAVLVALIVLRLFGGGRRR